MGFFSRIRNNTNQSDLQAQTKEPSKFEKAMDYFDEQQIRCNVEVDREVIERLYSALKDDNYDTVNDTSLVDAISSLDINIYNLCHAIIEQNFMLMRKVDSLCDKIDNIEKKVDLNCCKKS